MLLSSGSAARRLGGRPRGHSHGRSCPARALCSSFQLPTSHRTARTGLVCHGRRSHRVRPFGTRSCPAGRSPWVAGADGRSWPSGHGDDQTAANDGPTERPAVKRRCFAHRLRWQPSIYPKVPQSLCEPGKGAGQAPLSSSAVHRYSSMSVSAAWEIAASHHSPNRARSGAAPLPDIRRYAKWSSASSLDRSNG